MPTRRPRGARRRDAAGRARARRDRSRRARRSRPVSRAVRWRAPGCSPAGTRQLRDSFVLAATRIDGTRRDGAARRRGPRRRGAGRGDRAADHARGRGGGARHRDRASRVPTPTRRRRSRGGSAERHKREDRRARTDALHEGITAFESMYRDALAPGHRPSTPTGRCSRSTPARRPTHSTPARRPAGAFEFNPNEGLLLERLIAPPPCRGAARLGRLPAFAGIAQSAEQLTRNEQVKGSTPFPGSEASTRKSRVKRRRRQDHNGDAASPGGSDAGHDGEYLPLAGDALELVTASVLERDATPGNEIANR